MAFSKCFMYIFSQWTDGLLHKNIQRTSSHTKLHKYTSNKFYLSILDLGQYKIKCSSSSTDLSQLSEEECDAKILRN